MLPFKKKKGLLGRTSTKRPFCVALAVETTKGNTRYRASPTGKLCR